MDKRLSKARFLGRDYSIADIAIFPWVKVISRESEELAERPHLKRWLGEISERHAVCFAGNIQRRRALASNGSP